MDFFLVEDEQNFGSWGNTFFRGWGVLLLRKTLIFRFLLFKQATQIARVLTRPEKCHIMLFSPISSNSPLMSTLLSEIEILYFRK